MKLKHDKLLSNFACFAFNCKLRHYNPVYQQDFELIVSPSDLLAPGVQIKVECWDKDIVGKEFMGEVDVALRDVVRRSLSAAGPWVYDRAVLTVGRCSCSFTPGWK